jgi:hypothetical protein
MRFKTASGTVYELDQEKLTVTRQPDTRSGTLRKDANPIQLLAMPSIEVGYGVRMLLEPLGDTNTNVTVRSTTPVTEIWR